MAGQIITIQEAANISGELKAKGKKIVLAGGCFDIIHDGHLKYLNSAKDSGDILFVLLESDERIKELKGEDRPINNQKNRSIVLSSLTPVDFVIPLEGMTKNEEYDKLIVQIKPDVIAITQGDRNLEQRQRQSKLVGSNLNITEKVEGLSTTQLLKKVWEE